MASQLKVWHFYCPRETAPSLHKLLTLWDISPDPARPLRSPRFLSLGAVLLPLITPEFHFREEPKPYFSLRTGSLFALLLLALLFLGAKKTQLFELAPEEIARLKAERAEKERSLSFRFIDTPPDKEKNLDPEFLSDADRTAKSLQKVEKQDNDDPASIGNTNELRSKDPMPFAPQNQPLFQQNQPQARPQPPERAETRSKQQPLLDEPQSPKDQGDQSETEGAKANQDAEPVRTYESGTVPSPSGGPKPYRKLSQSEMEDARRRAARDMNLTAPAGAAEGLRHNNPGGKIAPNIGFDIDTGGHDLGPYLSILRELVRSNWRIPQIARFEVSGMVIVYFKLHKDGKITDAQIVQRCEHEPLDTASLNAIVNTIKAPPLPKHIDEDWIPIRFAFYYNMRPRH